MLVLQEKTAIGAHANRYFSKEEKGDAVIQRFFSSQLNDRL